MRWAKRKGFKKDREQAWQLRRWTIGNASVRHTSTNQEKLFFSDTKVMTREKITTSSSYLGTALL